MQTLSKNSIHSQCNQKNQSKQIADGTKGVAQEEKGYESRAKIKQEQRSNLKSCIPQSFARSDEVTLTEK